MSVSEEYRQFASEARGLISQIAIDKFGENEIARQGFFDQVKSEIEVVTQYLFQSAESVEREEQVQEALHGESESQRVAEHIRDTISSLQGVDDGVVDQIIHLTKGLVMERWKVHSSIRETMNERLKQSAQGQGFDVWGATPSMAEDVIGPNGPRSSEAPHFHGNNPQYTQDLQREAQVLENTRAQRASDQPSTEQHVQHTQIPITSTEQPFVQHTQIPIAQPTSAQPIGERSTEDRQWAIMTQLIQTMALDAKRNATIMAERNAIEKEERDRKAMFTIRASQVPSTMRAKSFTSFFPGKRICDVSLQELAKYLDVS